MENKANKVADVLVDVKSLRAYKESVPRSSPTSRGERYASQGYAPEFRFRRKELTWPGGRKLSCVSTTI